MKAIKIRKDCPNMIKGDSLLSLFVKLTVKYIKQRTVMYFIHCEEVNTRCNLQLRVGARKFATIDNKIRNIP